MMLFQDFEKKNPIVFIVYFNDYIFGKRVLW